MNPKDLLIEPEQFEEQLIDDPAPINDTIENEIELANCIVQTEEVPPTSVSEEETLDSNSNVHKCTICNKELLSAYTLANHMRSHTEERPYGCRVCEKFFKTKSNLNEHYRVHNPRLRWMKTSSKDLPSLTRVTVTSDEALTCDHCERAFASLDELSAHERALHADGEPREPPAQHHQEAFACDRCDKSFASESQLSEHAEKYCGGSGPAVAAAATGRLCPFCGKSFRSLATLENHKRVHTREKPFACDECDKPFRTKGNLLEHKRVHNTNLWLMKSDTKLAMDAAASFGNGGGTDNDRDRRFRCTYCAKPFRTHTALLNHERVHTREKPFECSECGKCYRTKSNLNEHMKGCHDADPSAGYADDVQVFTFKTQHKTGSPITDTKIPQNRV